MPRSTFSRKELISSRPIGCGSAAQRRRKVCSGSSDSPFVGIESGREEKGKFEKAGLTPGRAGKINAPYVREFPLHLECRLADRMTMGSHVVIIGQILDVVADESVLDEKGRPDIKKTDPVIFAPVMQAYFGVGENIGKAFEIGKEFKDKKDPE